MKFYIKNLLFFLLIFIVNAKPFNQADYPSLYNRILSPNYVGFVNTIQHVDNNANIPLVHYGHILNKNNLISNKYANFDANREGVYADIPTQDAGFEENRQPLDNRNKILEPSGNTFDDTNEFYTPLVNIYRSYPVDLYQQQQQQSQPLYYDTQSLLSPELNRQLDVLFTIESVPYPNPLIFFYQPSPARRFSFQMPQFPSFPQYEFTKMNNFFQEQFNPRTFMPEFAQNSMRNEYGNSPQLIQIGKNNKNIGSGSQYGIVQISKRINMKMPIETTTEVTYNEETSTLYDEDTTLNSDVADRIDENLKGSLLGK